MLKFLVLLHELCLSLDVREHFLTYEHFIENKSSTPNITFLVVEFKFQHFRRGIERSAGPLSHLHLDISCQTKVSDLEFLILIEKDIVGFEVPMQFV